MSIIEEVRQFLKDNDIDYLLVNSTNEFLVEYSELQENARYFLTNFSGSTGEAVISQKKLWLFVDGRYHQQADLEVDKDVVTVVKMKIGESFSKVLAEKIKPNKSFAIVSKKISQGGLEILQSALKDKNIEFKLLSGDPVMQFVESETKNKSLRQIEQIPVEITGMNSEDKIKLLTQELEDHEAMLITKSEEVSYLCNLRDFSKNYSSKIDGKCLVAKSYWWKCPAECKLDEYLHKLKNIERIYVDKTSISAYDYQILGEKAVPMTENYIRDMKSVKTNQEIEHYKDCFARTDRALSETRAFIENNENISEFDVAKTLEENFRKFGARSLSFKSIVAKDKNAALAHYSKNSEEEILKDGSLLLIDCGAYYEGGLATDITRVFVKGTPSKFQKQVYTVVLKGFLKAFNKKITATTTGFTLDSAARKVLDENKPEGFEFSHSLGHGIGISVHDNPPLLACSPLAKEPIVPNMCFTIEPGLYNPEYFGVRLENSCYMAEEDGEMKIKSFSNMCFEEKLIDYSLLTPTEKKQLKQFEVI